MAGRWRSGHSLFHGVRHGCCPRGATAAPRGSCCFGHGRARAAVPGWRLCSRGRGRGKDTPLTQAQYDKLTARGGRFCGVWRRLSSAP